MKKGFTLIELLVVVLIIGILSSVALPQYQRAVAKAKFVDVVQRASSLAKAQDIYYLANGNYSSDYTELDIDVVPEDTLVSFVPYILAAMCAAIAGLFTKRFRKMIHKQEQIYGVQFQDTDVVHLETTLYLSKDWLIWAGSCAMYKEHIKSISSAPRYGRVGSSNKVVIRSVDDKQYTIWCLSSSNVDRIKKWKNT